MRESNIIWATMKAWMTEGRGEVFRLSVFDSDFISGCSPEIKTIIAFYSKMYLTEECEELASALGDFSTLEEAQDFLLEGKEHFFKDVRKHDYTKGMFEIETEDNKVYAKLTAMIGSYKGTETFKILEEGEIEFVRNYTIQKLLQARRVLRSE